MTGLPNSLAARDIASLIHPYTNLEKHKVDGPLVIARGEGVYVYDEAGKRYLEGMAGLWSTNVYGHAADGQRFTLLSFLCGGTGARRDLDGLSSTAFPSGDTNCFIPRLKSALSKTSGGR